MEKFEIMSVDALADFVLSCEIGDLISFNDGVDYAINSNCNQNESIDSTKLCGNYSIWKTRIFDCTVVVIGYWGGGSFGIFDIETDSYSYFQKELSLYFDKHGIGESVLVDLQPVHQRLFSVGLHDNSIQSA